MRNFFSDLKLLRIDALSIIIYYPLIKIIYTLSKRLTFITPNFITIFGLLQFLLFSFIFYISGSPGYIALGLFIFAWMDVTDGFLARKKKLGSKLGAILDICSDRMVFFIFVASYGYYTSYLNDRSISLLFFTYSFCFIFLDTIHLIAGQVKNAMGMTQNPHATKSNSQWWLNQEFRFTSYIFICLWICYPTNLFFAYIAISLVALDYVSFLNKSIKSWRSR